MADQPPIKHRYKVFVNDNFHYMDESERYELGEFDSCESAIAACKNIVDEFLLSKHEPAQRAEEIWEGYTTFGEDPLIVTTDPACAFSAWDYAKQRCSEICENKG